MNTQTQVSLTDDRKEYLDTLAERCDQDAKAYSEYCTDTSDWEIDVSYVESETAELIERFAAKFGKGWQQELKEYCVVNFTYGIHRVTDEISSLSLGALECQPSDGLFAELSTLTDEELKYVQRQARECYVSDSRHCRGRLYLYHDYDRCSLVLDAERLADAIANLETK